MKSIDLVIMAGGEGKRLEPFTKIVPKPLLYVDGEPLLTRTINYFRGQGIGNKVYLLTYYKADLIKSYIENSEIKNIEIIIEEQPMGTIGGIALIKDKLSDNFIVSNCDIILKADLTESKKIFYQGDKLIMMIAFEKSVDVPYGIFEFNKEGGIENLLEKPVIKLIANAGIYLMKRDILNYMNSGHLNIDELFFNLMADNKIEIYSIPEKDFFDIGEFKYYKKVLEELC